MKNMIVFALLGAFIAPSLVQAGCTIGKRGEQQINSVITPVEPQTAGTAPYNSIWFLDASQFIPEEQAVLDRSVSSTSLVVPIRLDTVPPQPQTVNPPGTGGGRCDSIRTTTTPGDLYQTSYVERIPNSAGLVRHQIEFDMTFYVGNAKPVTGERSYWPVASWMLPTDGLDGASTLRLDYSGADIGYESSNANSLFYLYLDEVLIASVVVQTNKPKVELNWSTDGQVTMSFDVGPVSGQTVLEVPVQLANPKRLDFYPLSYQVGRVDLPYWLRPSKGTIYAYSYLIETPPPPNRALSEEKLP